MFPEIPYDPAEIEVSNAPVGFEPITSHSLFGSRAGPIFEKFNEDGTWVRAFRVFEKHCNPMKILHGGMTATFADIIVGTATYRSGATSCVTISLNTNYVGAAKQGEWVMGHATVVRKTKTMVFLNFDIYTDDRAVASGTAIFKAI